MKAKKMSGPPVHTVKLKFRTGVVLDYGYVAQAGDIYEVPKHMATELVSNGMAEYTDEGDPLEHDETGDADKDKFPTTTIEKPTSRDPKPAKRG
jgi:hypothetical protein